MERTDRLAEEMKREISEIIRTDIRDPRLPDFVTLMSVKVTKDLSYATIYISVFGDEEKKKNALMALQSAAGFIRHEIGRRMKIRYSPELKFVQDDSIEHGMHISEMLKDMNK